MGNKIKAVDDYIAKSADFAKPILEHFRELVHAACPTTEEKIKWGMPFFDYKDAMMCVMAAFKNHASIGFWKASLLKNKEGFILTGGNSSMGHLKNITSIKDIPPDKRLTALIKEAMKLNDDGIKVTKVRPTSIEIEVPVYFTKALAKNKIAKEVFEKFAPSHRKEYIQWITEAKTDVTREKRIASALEMLAEGKNRNWKYEKK